MNRFEGKNIVVTGGSSGIGFAVAQRIAGEGGRVLVTGTSDKKLASAEAADERISAFRNDASDLASADELAKEAGRLFGEIDGAFLNAGKGGTGGMVGSLTVESYRDLMDLNVGGPIFGFQALVPLMKTDSSVVITASVAKDVGMPGAALYSATKAAVRAMVRGFAAEFAGRVRVNCLSPGPIETPFFERLGRPAEVLEKIQQGVVKTNPMKRFGTAEEVAAVACFLLSDEASYVTGADYFVDGGAAQL